MDKNLAGMSIPILVIVVAVLVLGVAWVRTSNRFNQYRVVIKESKRNVDIALAKRYDTISEMIKVAKSFAKHEKTTFVDIIKLRQTATIQDVNRSIQNQDQAIGRIYALAENYPELKSSQEFLNLQDEINDENEQLAAAKRIVNNNISILNQKIVTFPASIVAGMKGMKEMEFLVEENIESKQSMQDFNYDV